MPDRPLVRRRTAASGALGVLLVSSLLGGCDVDDLRPPESDDDPTPPPQPGKPTPDEALVDQVVIALASAVALLDAARAIGPLRRPLGPLARAHAAHLLVLEGDGEAGQSPALPRDAGDVLTVVRRSERGLQDDLVEAAVRAESGALARLLASMSASVGQHLAALPSTIPIGAPR